jgi:hypothetical protein
MPKHSATLANDNMSERLVRRATFWQLRNAIDYESITYFMRRAPGTRVAICRSNRADRSSMRCPEASEAGAGRV